MYPTNMDWMRQQQLRARSRVSGTHWHAHDGLQGMSARTSGERSPVPQNEARRQQYLLYGRSSMYTPQSSNISDTSFIASQSPMSFQHPWAPQTCADTTVSTPNSVSIIGGANAMIPFPLHPTEVLYRTHVARPEAEETHNEEQEKIQAKIDLICYGSEIVRAPAGIGHIQLVGNQAPALSAEAVDFIPESREGFSRRSSDFWQIGRVFEIDWAQQHGDNSSDETRSYTTLSAAPGFHAKRRKMVVIAKRWKHCVALPIYTYAEKGLANPSVRKSEHCIIYTKPRGVEHGWKPELLASESPGRNERAMFLAPIRVRTSDRSDKLHPMSRLNIGKLVSPVENNWAVKDFGMVVEEDVPVLLSHVAIVREASGKAAELQRNRKKKSNKKSRTGLDSELVQLPAARMLKTSHLTNIGGPPIDVLHQAEEEIRA